MQITKKIFLIISSCAWILHAQDLPLVPLPNHIEKMDGTFLWQNQKASNIKKTINANFLSEESYQLKISPDGIEMIAHDEAGMFYALQTLKQLTPLNAQTAVNLPCLLIKDEPRYHWRGVHLDVGRHFFAVKDIKQFLDWLAFHKFNRFHWHLTDDQGWRLEIKKYPKLTAVGAYRKSSPPYGNRNGSDDKRYGGFYTQAEAKEIVAYAKSKHITVVPEIELPGHAAAAIAAYPELGNDDIPQFQPRVMTQWGVHPYIFSPKEKTFQFINDVLTEVCEIFPSHYIHIGGDEAPKEQWKASPFAQQVIKNEKLKNEEELQSWFIRRVEKMLHKKNRTLIGWDEIQEGGLPATAVMMVWRNENFAHHALSLGNSVIMSPSNFTYLDYYQNNSKSELAKGIEYETIGGYLPIDKVYSYNPSAVTQDAEQEKRILGVQAQLWSEYIKDWQKLEYQAFPRIAALSEVAWTLPKNKNYQSFLQRYKINILPRYDAANIHHGDVSEKKE